MAFGWSIDGRRVELGAAFPAGKLVVKQSGQTENELKLASAGEWQLSVGGETFTVKRVRSFMGPKTNLFRADGAKVPPTDKHVSPHPAAAGSLCQAHQAAAGYACARCGSFCCPLCSGSDLTHCRACCEKLLTEADKNAAAMVYFAPVVVFGVLGGVLLAVLGALAGSVAVAIAKRTESKAVKLIAAIGLYAVAVVAWVVIVAMIKS